MNITIRRERSTAKSTTGVLKAGDFQCFTLEDVVRDKKIHGETAIPAGVYKVVVNFSPRFRKALPLLLDVPGFAGIRIHPGNKAGDTEGCILPGLTRGTDWVGQSAIAFSALLTRIRAALAAGENVTITIEDFK